MLEIDVFENFRTFETPDSHQTKQTCDICGKTSETYLKIWDELEELDQDGFGIFYLICKGCLSRGIDKLNKHFQEFMKNEKRIE